MRLFALLAFLGLPFLSLVPVNTAATTAAVVASSAIEGSDPMSWVSDFIVTAPLAGVMLWLYLDERKERRQIQTQLIDLIKVIMPALEKSTITLDKVVLTQDRISQELNKVGLHEDDRGHHGPRAI